MNYTTSFAYDTDTLRLETITHPNSTTWQLTPQQTMGWASGTGNSLYDPADAVAQYIDERSNTWKFQTDRFGNVIHFQDPLSNVTTTERDHDGRPIRITQADPDGGGALTSPITKLGYSAAGDQVKAYLPDGNSQTWTYHSTWHLPLTYTNELGKTWENTYELSTGNLLTSEDPLSNVTSYTYTLIGLLESVTTPDPDGGGGLSASVT
ncbi:MAG TPA: hypothetical protein VFV87_21425, partial [Pirellulaceae bacterium]|nr:hypothetical protein [Pirellulaceae bacterium]